jgi:gamma-glutamylcyclotransferase
VEKDELLMLYFAYGSNLWRQQMRDRCPACEEVGYGVLRGYRWIISQRGYANIVLSACDEVHGKVYRLTESDEQSLDHYEGVPEGKYRKEIVPVIMDGHSTPCMVYVDPVEEEGVAWPEYVVRINRGISDAALSSGYVDRYLAKYLGG